MEITLSPERTDAAVAAGYWQDRLLTDYLDAWVARQPDSMALVDHNSERGNRLGISWTELSQQVDRLAIGLAGLGVHVGDVVAFQLPNWWQFVAVQLACIRIGAVGNPLMPIFRQRELSFMLQFADARVMVVPEQFRGFDYPAMIESLAKALPS